MWAKRLCDSRLSPGLLRSGPRLAYGNILLASACVPNRGLFVRLPKRDVNRPTTTSQHPQRRSTSNAACYPFADRRPRKNNPSRKQERRDLCYVLSLGINVRKRNKSMSGKCHEGAATARVRSPTRGLCYRTFWRKQAAADSSRICDSCGSTLCIRADDRNPLGREAIYRVRA